MTVEHKDLVDPYVHEPKGIAAATLNKAYFADGLGSGDWSKVRNEHLEGVTLVADAGYFLVANGTGGFIFTPAAHGSVYFSNFSTPYALAATTSFQKVNAVSTISGNSVAITEGVDSKLTYIGTSNVHLDIVFSATVDQSTGSNKNINLALYKNGILELGSEVSITTVSSEREMLSLHKDVHASAGDYFEIYCKISAAATVNFYTINLMVSTAGA